MVVDQNFLKVKRTLVTIFLFTLFINYSFADNLKFKKIVNLKGPWGSTFINNTELLGNEFFKLFLLFLYIVLLILVFYSFIKQTFQFLKVELNYSNV